MTRMLSKGLLQTETPDLVRHTSKWIKKAAPQSQVQRTPIPQLDLKTSQSSKNSEQPGNTVSQSDVILGTCPATVTPHLTATAASKATLPG